VRSGGGLWGCAQRSAREHKLRVRLRRVQTLPEDERLTKGERRGTGATGATPVAAPRHSEHARPAGARSWRATTLLGRAGGCERVLPHTNVWQGGCSPPGIFNPKNK
jgi:hypothetical protein